MKTYKAPKTTLDDNEVFVFGANIQGFHGAGAAGFASFGEFGNVWRKYEYASKPVGWKGKWNRKGLNGLQEGREGKSYGLVTVTTAGAKNSLTDEQRLKYIKELYECCRKHSELRFFLAQSGKTGLNGVNPKHLLALYTSIEIPNNLYFDESFAILGMVGE